MKIICLYILYYISHVTTSDGESEVVDADTETTNIEPETVDTKQEVVTTEPESLNTGPEAITTEGEAMKSTQFVIQRAYNNPFHPEDDEIGDQRNSADETGELEDDGELSAEVPEEETKKIKNNGVWYRPDNETESTDVWSQYRKALLKGHSDNQTENTDEILAMAT